MFKITLCPHGPGNPRNSEGDLIELHDGRLLFIWTQFFGGYEDHAAARLAGKTSADGGRTWSDAFVVARAPYGANVMSVSLLRNRAGKLLLFYLWKISTSDCRVMMRRSDDEGESWGEPLAVSDRPGYHVMNNARVVQTTGGRLLAPVAWNNRVFCYLSDDDGDSWRAGAGYAEIPGGGAMEPGLVELRNSDMLMIIRTPLGYIYQAVSADGGETWSMPAPMPLVSPSAPATVARLPASGDLLLIWNNQPLGAKARWSDRTPLTCALSRDEGATWQIHSDIEQNSEQCYAYTSVDFIKGAVYLTYYIWSKGKSNFDGTNIRLTVIPESYFE
jgi:sialidase-1